MVYLTALNNADYSVEILNNFFLIKNNMYYKIILITTTSAV